MAFLHPGCCSTNYDSEHRAELASAESTWQGTAGKEAQALQARQQYLGALAIQKNRRALEQRLGAVGGDACLGGGLWDDAVALVAGLSFQGFEDWRLPATPGTGSGFAGEGEFGHLYYAELGNVEGGGLASCPDPF